MLFSKQKFVIQRVTTTLKSFHIRFKHKYIYAMSKAYLRHLPEDEKFEITFQYEDLDVKVSRQFNLCRSINETISNFLQRVSVNIEKEVKKKNKKVQELPQIKASLLESGREITDEESICKDLFTTSKSITLKIQNTDYEVVVNSPWVSAIALPTSMMAGFFVYPTKFESLYTDRLKSDFIWYKSEDKKAWTLTASSSFIYQPSNSDVGCYLKLSCTPKNDELDGPKIEAESTVQVSAGPGVCPFEKRHKLTHKKCEGNIFRVVTYNILADLYCDQDYTREVLHPYCPPYALAIDYRKQLIIKELLGYNSDLICLQEVDRKVFKHDLNPLLHQLGYGGDLCLKGKDVAEGLATFYNSKRFKLINSHRHVLSDEITEFTEIWSKIETNPNLSARILDRSTTLQVSILEFTTSGDILVVGNTHLYFHPDADHIRLLQGGIIIKFLQNILEKVKNDFQGKKVSVILCGDFNSVPECGLYKLYTGGEVPEDCVDYQSNKQEAISGLHLKQPLKLQSACGTPEYTNFTAGFAACLDYIFYEQTHLQVDQVVPLPGVDELNANTALPSVVFPSDHIALISDLRWI